MARYRLLAACGVVVWLLLRGAVDLAQGESAIKRSSPLHVPKDTY